MQARFSFILDFFESVLNVKQGESDTLGNRTATDQAVYRFPVRLRKRGQSQGCSSVFTCQPVQCLLSRMGMRPDSTVARLSRVGFQPGSTVTCSKHVGSLFLSGRETMKPAGLRRSATQSGLQLHNILQHGNGLHGTS